MRVEIFTYRDAERLENALNKSVSGSAMIRIELEGY